MLIYTKASRVLQKPKHSDLSFLFLSLSSGLFFLSALLLILLSLSFLHLCLSCPILTGSTNAYMLIYTKASRVLHKPRPEGAPERFLPPQHLIDEVNKDNEVCEIIDYAPSSQLSIKQSRRVLCSKPAILLVWPPFE